MAFRVTSSPDGVEVESLPPTPRRGRPRLSGDQRRDGELRIRLTEDELERCHARATEAGYPTTAAWVRWLMLGPTEEPESPDDLPDHG